MHAFTAGTETPNAAARNSNAASGTRHSERKAHFTRTFHRRNRSPEHRRAELERRRWLAPHSERKAHFVR
ncbi:MAG: hypothetical protein Q4B19_08635, partial [Clostridia bacterium]|nr:hypothetical protein [Clostridia bacterium]